MTSDLAQTALDFCRECLGWEDAAASMWGQCSNKMVVAKRGRSVVERLRYTDLNAVMEAVRGWCIRNKLGLTLCCDQSGFEVIVFSASFDEIDEEATNQNPCHALLAACVEAARKLRAA